VAPDVVQLSAGPVELAALDGRYISAETAAAFTGRVMGLYAREGAVTFDAVRYEGRDDEAQPAPRELSMSGGTA
jgi:xylan 1,4-beta-xylosidase